MLADLESLLTAVFCTADDLLPGGTKNARRSVTDAEVVTLTVAQALMKAGCDREFLARAAGELGELFPKLPAQPGYWKRRRRLTETIEWLIGVFASDCPATTTTSSCWTRPRSSAAARRSPTTATAAPTAAGFGAQKADETSI